MTTVSVVYHSVHGTTRLLAEAVHRGAASEADVDARLLALEARDVVEGRWVDPGILELLDASDAIVLGCPTHMGSVSAPMKAFLDATLQRYYSRAWADKVGAAFTVSATPSGDKLATLGTLLTCAMQLGMIWVGQDRTALDTEGVNRLGIYLGAGAQAIYGAAEPSLSEGDLATGEGLGARVARVARALAA